MVDIMINERKIKAKEGSTLLQVAQALKIDIPVLCFHNSLSAFGACRLCMVEVKTNGKWQLAASCQTEVSAGMEVKTDSDKAKERRKLAAGLIYYKYPATKVVRDIAKKLGIKVLDSKVEGYDCIFCGLCARTCHEVVGVNALKFHRSLWRERLEQLDVFMAGFPLKIFVGLLTLTSIVPLLGSFLVKLFKLVVEPEIEFIPDACVGCGSCAYVCPTGFVKVESGGDKHIVWDKEFELISCKNCGKKGSVNYFV